MKILIITFWGVFYKREGISHQFQHILGCNEDSIL